MDKYKTINYNNNTTAPNLHTTPQYITQLYITIITAIVPIILAFSNININNNTQSMIYAELHVKIALI